MMRTIVVAVAMLLAVPHLLHAQRGRALVEEGNRLYRDSRFEEAHQRYLDALREAPESDLIRFNDGNALYKTDDYQRAIEAYRAAVESGDPALQSRAWYNIGNALFRAQDLEGAAEAFKQTLRLDPADVDAKHNLERVLEQQEEQQQNQQQPQQQQQQQQQQSEQQDDDEGQGGQQGQEDQSQPQQQQQDSENRDQQQPQGQQQGPPPEMTPEEAQRLLQAIQEDPSKIERQRKTTAARRGPRKKW